MKILTVIVLLLFKLSLMANAYAQSRGGAFATVPPPGAAQSPAVAAPQPTAAQPSGAARPTLPTQQAAQQQQEQLRIVADPATNSLIIYGTAQEFQNIKNILKELDAIPRQVLLDVLIMEVSLDDSEQFGIDYELNRGTTTIFDRNFGSRGAVLGRVLSQIGVPATGPSLFPAGISGVIGTNQTVRALINALMTDSRVRILSSPSVLATDNRPARIQVGSEEPQATGTLTAATGAVTPSSSTTIQYRNTGRIVTIIPQVNSQGLVNLQILAEVSQRGTNVTVGQDSYPSFDIRQAETTAVVHDGATLAIGGIIAENRSRDRRGIPYLMDIPVVGRFFGTTSDTMRRTELIMLITPNVIRNRNEAATVTDEFKAKLSDARKELERLEKDQAKLKPKPRPEALPPMPVPNTVPEAPKPNPSNVPDRGTVAPSAQPISSNVWENSPQGATAATFSAPSETVELPHAAAVEGRAADARGNVPAAPGSSDRVEPKPQGFALSMLPARPQPPVVAVLKPEATKPPETMGRIWAVQVASLADNEDAEILAAKLRHDGQQAYVMMARVEDKIWHRVRIGKFVSQQEAEELKKALASMKEFRQAYVALNN